MVHRMIPKFSSSLDYETLKAILIALFFSVGFVCVSVGLFFAMGV